MKIRVYPVFRVYKKDRENPVWDADFKLEIAARDYADNQNQRVAILCRGVNIEPDFQYAHGASREIEEPKEWPNGFPF